MKILNTSQIRDLDQYTILQEPISSIDLMERAAEAVTERLCTLVKTNEQVMIFCGMGNNGGDGLAVARLLIERGYLHVSAYVIHHSPEASDDFQVNYERLINFSSVHWIETVQQIPQIASDAILIDAILGSGLSRPVDGLIASVIERMNQSKACIYAIDFPSGMYGDKLNISSDTIVQAHQVFTFHAPKLTLLLPASAPYAQGFEILDIGLNQEYSESLSSKYRFLTSDDIGSIFKQRNRFSHKGDYGHALIATGSKNMMGAALLSVRAALHSGAGLVTAYIPKCGYSSMLTYCPEAMVLTDENAEELTRVPDTSKFIAIGVGPGLGNTSNTKSFLKNLLGQSAVPLVLDADALNILAEEKEWLGLIPKGSVLTPHPGEFRRLTGTWKDDLEKLNLQIDFAKRYQVVVVLKGAHSTIADSNGLLYFNSTGNPGMAKGGSGDVLTGVITSLLAQGYPSLSAALLGVFVHGMAGDFAAAQTGQTGMIAGDLITYLPTAFNVFEQ